MAGQFGAIQVGASLEIQRSDGRTHQAVVTALHEESGSVTVEWSEQGAAKGKRVALGLAFSLNPHLAPPPSDRGEEEPSGGDAAARLPRSRPPLSNPAPRRKSPCVLEVERLRQRREQRRLELLARREAGQLQPHADLKAMIDGYRAALERGGTAHLGQARPAAADASARGANARQALVCVRKRPLSRREAERQELDVVTLPGGGVVTVHEARQKLDLTRYLQHQTFCFDHAFDTDASTESVYERTARPLLQAVFCGGRATCFAYGQTGSGKTHTMGGDFSAKRPPEASKGIYALVARDVFCMLQEPAYAAMELRVFGAFFEIYWGKVYDLLNWKNPLRVLEDSRRQVQVVGLLEHEVARMEDVMELIEKGSRCRTSGRTSANTRSSRSHAIFQIVLKRKGEQHGKFSLIDLAGNERGADTSGGDRQTRLEGAEINKSLLALKECIRALGCSKGHAPFRASKLTQVLRDSFIGENSCTCMIATISPGMKSCEHTLNTLRYASQVKELSVDPNAFKQFQPIVPRSVCWPDDLPRLWAIQSSPETEEFKVLCVQNEERALPQSLKFASGPKGQKKRKEIDERTLGEDRRESLQWLKVFLHMAKEIECDMDFYAEQFEAVLTQKIAVLSEIQDRLKSFRSNLHNEELGKGHAIVKRPRVL